MPNNRYLNRIWWSSALVLVLTMLGHDVFMASATHSAPVAPVAATMHLPDSAHEASGGSDPAPEHPNNCGSTGTAIPFSGNQLELSDGGTSSAFSHGELSTIAHDLALGWSEPLWPPGTQRALYQVYRI